VGRVSSRVIIPTYAEIPRIPQRWLWYPWIARDVMTLLAGKAGSLKGTSLCDIIARISNGESMPDRAPLGYPQPLPAGDIIAITPEDRANEAMAYRLFAAGADLSRVWNFTSIRLTSGNEKAWKLTPEGLDELAEFADAIPALGLERYGRPGAVRLFYVDPMLAVIDNRKVASNELARANVVEPLDALAKRYGAGVALINHTVKDGTIAGSQGLVDAARLTLMFAPVGKSAPRVKQLSIYKSNIGPDSDDVEPLRYRQAGSTDETRRVEWMSEAQAAVSEPEGYRTLSLVRSAPEPLQPQPTARELFQSLRRNVRGV
jgi:AAA domain